MKHESTPFHHIDITTPKNHESDKNGGIWARMYWSQNAGVYGHQVVMEFNAGNGFETFKTGGCGFCKSSAALEHFYREVFGARFAGGGDLAYYAGGTKTYKGGNCYVMSLAQFKKLESLRK